MVLVCGLTAIPVGALPTGMVAVTLMAAVTAWAVVVAGDADAAEAVGAAGASPAMAAAIRVTAHWVSLILSCFLAGPCPAVYAGASQWGPPRALRRPRPSPGPNL